MPGVYVFWWVGKFLSSDQQVMLDKNKVPPLKIEFHSSK
uniref:Uncharacterized protein n=1 Tax=Kluyvera cryocrescens TaxID=580 RepID=A0A2K9V0A4_KLUCR|nr:hypothetical protein [Kluyvera cryocrescens]URZ93801.1 hypothetical protein [Klebsiella pneumoniae]WJR85223.1 hypothetical protein [Enterobacter hormaechei subsp. xiangfangensis]WJR85411.1 hypothetical protein [Enterobacter hormaechei subsp. xiangfangensis]WJR85585.1 hypothetical protein [Enterobacter hormaechei subsp. steigerwaltii]